MPIAEFSLDGASSAKVIIDVDTPLAEGNMVRVAVGADGLIKASRTFDASLAGLKTIAGRVFDELKELGSSEAEVEMGFKFTAGAAGVILTKADGEAHVKLKLVWKK
jgi:hypothetical protein